MKHAIFALLATLAAVGPALAAPPKVKIETGVVAGTTEDGVNAFRNIPFAAAPEGALRWRPPAKAKAWKGERNGAKAGPSCPQPMNANGAPNSGGANGPISEDCLQLNVFAPAGAKKAPVMVWVHGGAHRTGAGWVYDGSHFARDGVVLVAINYRLGALGYFAHPALTKAAKPGEPVANYGLMDQIAALEWVKRNIAKFGGDPSNVTLFGESAGGMSTLAILATPKATGLYHKAVVESGLGWFQPKTLASAETQGANLITTLGITDADAAKLRAIPVADLVKLSMDYGPIPDGVLLTETASQAFAAGRANDVPLMIGSNSGEDSLMGPWKPEMAARIPAMAKQFYPEEAAKGDEALARAIFTDTVMGGPARWIAGLASSGKPTWLYYFSYVGSRFRPAVTTSAHASEIQYVFDYWGRRTPLSAVAEDDKAMAALMHSCWVAFAKTSAPTCASGPAWPAYTPSTDQLMEFGADSGVRTHFRKTRLDVIQAVTLPSLKLGK